MGIVTAGAGVAFGLALGLLGAFFATKREVLDRLAEWSFVIFGVLAVPAIVAVVGRFPDQAPLAWAVAAAGIVGAAGLGLGELAITLGFVDFHRAATALTVAFVCFLAWIAGVSLLALATGALPLGLGWLGVLAIGVGIIVVALMIRQPGVIQGERQPGRIQIAGVLASMVGVVAWMLWLALSL